MSVNFQFSDMEFNTNDIKDAIIDFYLNGDREDEKFMENNMKFQQFIYHGFVHIVTGKADHTAIHSFTSSSLGKYFFGAQATKCIPILAQPTIKELPIL